MADSTASAAPPGPPRRARVSRPTALPGGAALNLLARGTSAGLEPGRGRVKGGRRWRSEAGQLCFGTLARTCALSPPSAPGPLPVSAGVRLPRPAALTAALWKEAPWVGHGTGDARAAVPVCPSSGRDPEPELSGVCGSQRELRLEVIGGVPVTCRTSYPSRCLVVLSSAFLKSSAKRSGRIAGGRVKLLAL